MRLIGSLFKKIGITCFSLQLSLFSLIARAGSVGAGSVDFGEANTGVVQTSGFLNNITSLFVPALFGAGGAWTAWKGFSKVRKHFEAGDRSQESPMGGIIMIILGALGMTFSVVIYKLQTMAGTR